MKIVGVCLIVMTCSIASFFFGKSCVNHDYHDKDNQSNACNPTTIDPIVGMWKSSNAIYIFHDNNTYSVISGSEEYNVASGTWIKTHKKVCEKINKNLPSPINKFNLVVDSEKDISEMKVVDAIVYELDGDPRLQAVYDVSSKVISMDKGDYYNDYIKVDLDHK